MRKIRNYVKADNESIDVILTNFEEYYCTRRLDSILTNHNENPRQAIELIKNINPIQSSTMPVDCLGDLDPTKVIEEELGGLDVIPTKFNFIKRATPWEGYLRGQVVMWVAPPGVGKSLGMANEVVEMLRQGFSVYWVALGDLMRLDMIIRITTLVTGIPYPQVSINPSKYFSDEVKELTSKLFITVVPAGHETIDGIKDYIEGSLSRMAKSRGIDSIDCVVIDYDANVKGQHDGMYKEGEHTYNVLTQIARPITGKYRLVFIASQPKIHYWSMEELNKDCASDSSRKQAVVDLMITIGCSPDCQEGYKAGVIKAAKVRRGSEGEKSYYMVKEHGEFEELSREDYSRVKVARA